MQRFLITIALLALLALSGCRAAAHLSQGNEHYELGRYEKAAADYDEAIRLRPDLAEAYNNRGVAHYELGRHEAAIADYDKAIRQSPDYIEAYHNRGSARAELGRYEEAAADWETALKLAQAAGNDHLAASIEEALETVKNP